MQGVALTPVEAPADEALPTAPAIGFGGFGTNDHPLRALSRRLMSGLPMRSRGAARSAVCQVAWGKSDAGVRMPNFRLNFTRGV